MQLPTTCAELWRGSEDGYKIEKSNSEKIRKDRRKQISAVGWNS